MGRAQAVDAMVVGGGVAGLAAALLLTERGQSVALVEAAPAPGGLLRSRRRDPWGSFDFGTHLFSETGVEELDDVLLRRQRTDDAWVAHPACRQDIFFGGERRETAFPDARVLPAAVHDQGLAELLALPPLQSAPATLEEQIAHTFGRVFLREIFAPIMRKYTGRPLAELAPDAHLLFGLHRLIAGTAEQTIALKAASPWHDARLAFHDPQASARPVRHYYPRAGGIGRWTDDAVATLQARGAAVLCGSLIAKVTEDDAARAITSLTLADGREFAARTVVWTGPLPPLFQAAGVPGPALSGPPSFCRTILVDLVLDQPLATAAHWITCHDPASAIFRVTNYAAVEGRPGAAPARLTLEILQPPEREAAVTEEDLSRELLAMRLIPPGAKILAAWRDDIARGFPIMTPAFLRDTRALAETAAARWENVRLAGRATGRVFFMRDVLTDVFRQLTPS